MRLNQPFFYKTTKKFCVNAGVSGIVEFTTARAEPSYVSGGASRAETMQFLLFSSSVLSVSLFEHIIV